MKRNLPLGLACCALVLSACSSTNDSGANGAGPGGSPNGDGGATSSADGGADGGVVTNADFYVDPVNGNDSNPGSLAAPFQTIVRARDAVRAMQKTKAVLVMLRAGTYYNPAGVTFDQASDDGISDTARVTWAAYPGETPIVSGGTRITGFTHGAGNVWTVSIDPSKAQNFENLFYNGERRMRPRLYSPTNNPDIAGTPYLGSFMRVASEVDVATESVGCSQLSADGVTYKCSDRFQYDPNDPIAATWANLAPTSGNACGATAGNAAIQGDIEIDLFEAWTMEKMRVSCVDTAAHIVYLTAPTPLSGSKASRGFVKGHRYVVENVKDVFDASHVPGTWFLDRSNASSWTLSYAANDGEDPNHDTVVMPQAQPILTLSSTKYLNLQGITFEADNYIPAGIDDPNGGNRFGPKKIIDGFNIDENGDNWLPGAVNCASCQNVTLDGVSIRHTTASGLQIASIDDMLVGSAAIPANAITVQNSLFYDLGDNGIHVGNVPYGGDKDEAVVQNVTIKNDLIEGYSRVFADGEGFSQGNGHNVTYDHNDVTDGYHAGISICNLGCASKDHDVVSSYNHIWNVMKGITSDGGTLYYNTGGGWGTGAGNQIAHNLIHDVSDSVVIDNGVHGSGYGGQGIYLDVQTGDVDVTDNVVFRVTGVGLAITAGQHLGAPANRISNNIFANAAEAMFFFPTPWPEGCPPPSPPYDPTRAKLTSNVFYFDRTFANSQFSVAQGCAYSCGLPFTQMIDYESNLYWRQDGGFATDTHQFHVLTSLPDGVAVNDCDNGTSPGDWMSFTPNVHSPNGDWQDSYTNAGGTVVLNEDKQGKIADPGFAVEPPQSVANLTLAAAPVDGFDPSQTNDTITNAGRAAGSPQLAAVPDTFPTYFAKPSDF